MTVTLAKNFLKNLKRFGSYTATIFSEEMQYSRAERYKNVGDNQTTEECKERMKREKMHVQADKKNETIIYK